MVWESSIPNLDIFKASRQLHFAFHTSREKVHRHKKIYNPHKQLMKSYLFCSQLASSGLFSHATTLQILETQFLGLVATGIKIKIHENKCLYTSSRTLLAFPPYLNMHMCHKISFSMCILFLFNAHVLISLFVNGCKCNRPSLKMMYRWVVRKTLGVCDMSAKPWEGKYSTQVLFQAIFTVSLEYVSL